MSQIVTRVAKVGGGDGGGGVGAGSGGGGASKRGSDGEDSDLGKQRNFYRQISGAGDGHALQTTASDYGGPKSPQHIVKPQQIMTDNTATGAESDSILELRRNVPKMSTFASTQTSNGLTLNDKQLDLEWQDKIKSLQDQVSIPPNFCAWL